jgi:hypothetical protein
VQGLPQYAHLGTGAVDELQTMLRYCKSLKFDEEPNYGHLKQQLQEIFDRSKYEYDYAYDWVDHAATLEKKSTYQHLLGRQQMLARRNSSKKLPDDPKNEEDK